MFLTLAEISNIRDILNQVPHTLNQLRDINLPDHEDKTLESQLQDVITRIKADLGWIDDRLTERIVYAQEAELAHE
jgi:hypothetical protein